MSKFSQKFLSVVLTGATILSFSGALIPAANAQSTANLQAQIAALLAQISQLQAKLGTTGTTTTSASYTFTKDLTVGSRGADVTALQQVLISKGFLKIAAPTGYFGALTKAAVSAWQASAGIRPTAGYFGPKSRAVLNAMAVSPTPTPTPVTPGSPSPTPAPVAGTGLAIATGSNNPVSGALISPATGNGAARTLILGFSLTAGSGSAVNVSEVKFHKVGVLSDSSINGAYIVNGGKVVAQYNSLTSGVIDFSGLALSIPAGQTMNFGLAIDVAGGLSAGNSVSFSLASGDVTSSDASGNSITATGSATGNIFTVTQVSNPSLASLTIAANSIATTVSAGTTNNIVGAWNFTVQNSKTWLQSINFRVIGSANKTDLRNVKLMVNGVQAGAALASVDASGNAYFDLSSAPATLNTGSNNVQIYADVMGSPSYTFQFEILNSYDVLAVDSQYNVPILAASNVGTQVTINAGTVTVSQNSGTPTGQIAVGQSGVTLGKFNFYAGGEAVRVKFLGFQLAFSGGATPVATTAGLSAAVRNVSLIDDAGGQIGSTINTPPSSNGNTTGAASTCDNTVSSTFLATGTYVDCFGTSSSNVNYVVPANTTRVLSLKADIQSGAGFGTVVASLLGETSNVQGLTSSQTASTGGANGSALTLSSNLLTVSQNNALGNQNITQNSSHVRIGSYSFTASSASGVTVNTLTITAGAVAGSDFQNLGVWVNGTQFGTTQGVISNSGVYSFSGSPFTVAAGATTNVDVYSDILSGATSTSPATTLSGCSATGVVSFNSISCTGSNAPAGQGITISGQATLTIGADSSNPASSKIVMGSTGNSLAAYRFTETSNVENVKVTDLTVTDAVAATSSVKAAFSNLSLYQGSTLLGTAGTAVVSSTTAYNYTFHFGTPIVVPQANSVTLVLKGDAASYASSGASDNTTHTFKIAAANYVTALGQSSNATSSVTISSANGNVQTIQRTALTASGTALGSSSGRVKTTSDNLATLTFSANSAGSAALNSVTVTFSGSAASSATFLGSVQLIDANNNDVTLSDGATLATSSACTSTATCTATWTFGTNGFSVSAGSSYAFTVRVNDFNTATAASNSSVSLAATIQNATDVTYRDGLDSAASAVNLPTTAVPLNLNSASFAQGT